MGAASMLVVGARWQVEYRRQSQCVQAGIDVLMTLAGRIEPAREPSSSPLTSQPSADAAPGEESPGAREPVAEPSAAAVLTEEIPAGFEPAPEPSVGAELAPSSPVTPALAPTPSPGMELAQEPFGATVVNESVNGAASSISVERSASRDLTRRVFLVHGRDEKWKQAVIDLLGQTGPYDVTILNERPKDRQALVEHFEGQAEEPCYAVVLLTADDVGAPRSIPTRSPTSRLARAKQLCLRWVS